MSFSFDELLPYSYEQLESFNYDIADIRFRRNDISSLRKIDQYRLMSDTESQSFSISVDNVRPLPLKLASESQLSNVNLLYGFNPNFDWIRSSKSKLDSLLEMIKQRRIDPFENDFVSMRGYLRTIMTTPFTTKDNWRIGASKLGNTIFLGSYRKSPEPSHRNQSEANRHAYRFYNLRSLLTTGSNPIPDQEEDSDFANLKKEYISVFQSRVRRRNCKDMKLLYAGELDALQEPGSDESDLKNYVSIKMTTKEKDHKELNIFERLKLTQWWSESVLSGCKNILIAQRDRDFNVEGFQNLHVDSIPNICRKYYEKNRALDVMAVDFLYEFLNYVQQTMKDEEDPNIVYMFEYSYQHGVRGQSINCYMIEEGLEESRLLPQWLIQLFHNSSSRPEL